MTRRWLGPSPSRCCISDSGEGLRIHPQPGLGVGRWGVGEPLPLETIASGPVAEQPPLLQWWRGRCFPVSWQTED